MVKAATKPKVSKEEVTYRDDKFSDSASIVNKNNLLCTSCNVSVRPSVLKGKVKVHPFLDTLLCDKCYSFYGDGNFSVDEEDGSDKYCRWCGQGGTLYLCSSCTGGFCKKCIKRNLPRSELKSVESDDWSCFCCEVKPLYELRALCWAASNYVRENFRDESDKKKRRRKMSVSSQSEKEDKGDSDAGSGSEGDEKKGSSKKKSSTAKSPATKPDQRLEKKKIRALITKMNSVAQDAIKMCDLSKGKLTELKSKKMTIRYVKDEETALTVSSKLVNSLASLENLTGKFKTLIEDYVEQWSALNLKEGTNGEVVDKKDAEDDEHEKEESKDDSDDSTSKRQKDQKNITKTKTPSKNEDDGGSAKDDEDESKQEQSDSDDQTSCKKKNASRRKPSRGKDDDDDGKDDDSSVKSLRKKRNGSSVESATDETPKRKRSTKGTKNNDGGASGDDDEDESKQEQSDPEEQTSSKKKVKRTPSTESHRGKKRGSSVDSTDGTPKKKRSKRDSKINDSEDEDKPENDATSDDEREGGGDRASISSDKEDD